MQERNSENKPMWVSVVMGVLLVVVAAVDTLLGTGLIPTDHLAATILGGVVSVVGPIVGYTVMRPAKHKALAQREAVAKANPPKAE